MYKDKRPSVNSVALNNIIKIWKKFPKKVKELLIKEEGTESAEVLFIIEKEKDEVGEFSKIYRQYQFNTEDKNKYPAYLFPVFLDKKILEYYKDEIEWFDSKKTVGSIIKNDGSHTYLGVNKNNQVHVLTGEIAENFSKKEQDLWSRHVISSSGVMSENFKKVVFEGKWVK